MLPKDDVSDYCNENYCLYRSCSEEELSATDSEHEIANTKLIIGNSITDKNCEKK